MSTPRDALPALIKTARLSLRSPHLGDLETLVTLANNWKISGPTASLPFPYLEEHGRGFIERFIHKPEQRLFAIADAQDDNFMGAIGFKFDAARPPELGYWLGEPHWSRGYAPEAVQGLLQAAKTTQVIPRVTARVLEENPASIRVLEKSGFVVAEHTQSVVDRHRGKPLLIMSWSAS
jgi:RimJ/RimL family protein N-acetyltransferase